MMRQARFLLGLACLIMSTGLACLITAAIVTPVLTGWSAVSLSSGSMAPAIAVGDVVMADPRVTHPVPRGAVIVFDNPSGPGWVTHRVVEIGADGLYRTRGDANEVVDSTPVAPAAVLGRARAVVPFVGLPSAWVSQGDAVRGLLALLAGALLFFLSRYGLHDRFNPWLDAPRPSSYRPRPVPAVRPLVPARRFPRIALSGAQILLLTGVGVVPPITSQAAYAATTSNATSTISVAAAATAGYYLKNTGSTDTASAAVLPLSTVAPTISTLHNYDTNRDAFPGLLLNPGTGLAEVDPTKIQVWEMPVTSTLNLSGNASLRLWSAMKNFQSSQNGSVQAGLYDCDGKGKCVQIGTTATITSTSGWGGGTGWIVKDWSFGSVSYVVKPSQILQVRVAVGLTAQNGMWFAYDRTGYPSVLTFGAPSSGAPTVAMTPPPTYVRGAAVPFTVTASSPTGIASVAIQYFASGGTSWTTLCTDTTAPYSCTGDSTGAADGSTWDLRAVATDLAGATATSATFTTTVDNGAPAVTMQDPGSPLTGTVPLTATASDAVSGVAQVAFQFAVAGTSTWTSACTATTSPWSCSFDTTTLTSGMYDVRAVATDTAGNTTASAPVLNRQVGRALTYGSTGVVATRTSSGSATVQYPAGTVSGDLLLLVQANGANQAITTPTGWTLAADQATSSPAQFRFTVWWKAAAAETSVPVSVNTDSAGTSLWVVRYARAAGLPAVTTATTLVREGVNAATATLTPAPDVTTTAAATAISLTAVRAPNTLSLQTARAYSFRESSTSTLTGVVPTLGVADAYVGSASSPLSPTWAQPGTAAQWAWATLAFK